MAPVLSMATLAVAVGCTSHSTTQLRTAADVAAMAAEGTDPQFQDTRAQVPFDNHAVGRGASPEYSLRDLTIPSIGDSAEDSGSITAQYFRSDLPGPKPLVIVLPIYARYTYPSNRMSKHIQRHSRGGVHVLAVQGAEFLIDWSQAVIESDEDRFLDLFRVGVDRERTVIMDIRRLIDWAEQQPEIDGSRVALMGFSRSAIVAATTATQEPRLAATVLIMGGAHPHQVIARCTGKRTSAVQDHVEEAFGWDQDEFEHRLLPIFRDVDTANYSDRVDPNTVLMFEAGKDGCVPEVSRAALWETMGRPKKYTLNYGHRISFLSMTPLGGSWMCRRTWEFLEDRLLDPK